MKGGLRTFVVFLLAAAFGVGVALLGRQSFTPDDRGSDNLEAKSERRSEVDGGGELAVSRALRSGDPKLVEEALRALLEHDPAAFLRLMARLPVCDDAMIREAASRLEVSLDEAVALLNDLGCMTFRDAAWEEFIASRVGIDPDEELFDCARKAETSASFVADRPLFVDAAKDRPEEFFEMLCRRPTANLRTEFLELVLGHDYELGMQLADQMPAGSSMRQYDFAYNLQAMARVRPTAENLPRIWEQLGPAGQGHPLAQTVTWAAFYKANQEERGRIIEFLSGLPDIDRNRLLASISRNLSIEEVPSVLDMVSSLPMQKNIVENHSRAENFAELIEALEPGPVRDHALELREGEQSPIGVGTTH